MNTNFEYYRIFYYVAKYRNFTQAARHLMNSQPNITRMIRSLEEDLGCQLFLRTSRGVSLTPEGEKLLSHVRVAVEEIRDGERDLKQLISLQRGTVSIGVSEVALRCFLLPVLKKYQKYYPHVRLKVTNHSTPQAVKALQTGSVDIAFVTTPLESSQDLQVVPIRDIQEVAICGSNFSALLNRPVTLGDIDAYPIVSLGEQTSTHAFYARLFRENGLIFSPDIEAATADQVLPMVKNDLGVGFVPEAFLQDETEVYRLDLRTPIPPRNICCIRLPGKPLSLAAQALLRMMEIS